MSTAPNYMLTVAQAKSKAKDRNRHTSDIKTELAGTADNVPRVEF